MNDIERQNLENLGLGWITRVHSHQSRNRYIGFYSSGYANGKMVWGNHIETGVLPPGNWRLATMQSTSSETKAPGGSQQIQEIPLPLGLNTEHVPYITLSKTFIERTAIYFSLYLINKRVKQGYLWGCIIQGVLQDHKIWTDDKIYNLRKWLLQTKQIN